MTKPHKTYLTIAVIAIVLIAVGGICWKKGCFEKKKEKHHFDRMNADEETDDTDITDDATDTSVPDDSEQSVLDTSYSGAPINNYYSGSPDGGGSSGGGSEGGGGGYTPSPYSYNPALPISPVNMPASLLTNPSILTPTGTLGSSTNTGGITAPVKDLNSSITSPPKPLATNPIPLSVLTNPSGDLSADPLSQSIGGPKKSTAKSSTPAKTNSVGIMPSILNSPSGILSAPSIKPKMPTARKPQIRTSKFKR